MPYLSNNTCITYCKITSSPASVSSIGVSNIKAGAAMLGQLALRLIPYVFGVRLTGCLTENATSTNPVLQ